MKEKKWIRLLAYMTGLVNQELLLRLTQPESLGRLRRASIYCSPILQNGFMTDLAAELQRIYDSENQRED
jgi:hypothetical protein